MDNLFDKDFYPTPREVIEKMLNSVEVEGKTILEPSAGSGAIIDVLFERGANRVVACETNAELRKILSHKCELIGKDFLLLTDDKVCDIDLIVANVPFSDQNNHILHMLEIAPEGCEIITLCNSSLFASWNRNIKQQQIIEKIESWGYHEELGNVFSQSDRPTDVNVSLIHVFKPGKTENMFDDFFIEEEPEQMQTVGIIQYNVIRDYVNRYVEALKRFEGTMNGNKAINELISAFGDTGIKFGAFRQSDHNLSPINFDRFRKELQMKAWRHVFNELKMGKYLTTKTMRQLDSAISKQENFPFTMKNIYRMIELLIGTHQSRMQDCIVEVFDLICSYSAENSTAGEKWKTNSNYMINRKFIVPGICRYDSIFNNGDYTQIGWSESARLDDINKALCLLTAKDYNTIPMLRYAAEKTPWGKKFEWGFFVCKGFKKGTMHFEFQSEDVWTKFNQTVAKIRGWELPQNSRK